MRPWYQYMFFALVTLFAGIGIVVTGVFVAMQFDLLNVRGSIDDRNQFFIDAAQDPTTLPATTTPLLVASSTIQSTSTSTSSSSVPTTPPSTALKKVSPPPTRCTDTTQTSCTWSTTPEWDVIKRALVKDKIVLDTVSVRTGVPARMIASVVVPEQVRFFTSNREVFKRWFEPMKLLGSLSQFSLGVSGIKEDTAANIEAYAQDPHSPWYPGPGMYDLVAHTPGSNVAQARFARLTDEKDHYYSYLYTALFIKEITAQWERAGYDIHDNPEVIVTLFNLGFEKSVPNATPTAGGAPITVGGMTYTYGTLGGAFYRSEELVVEFPKK
jgi:hypothetical protein